MESNGILSGNAFKLFRGSIDFVKGCAGSVGNEKEDVLLLGENVVNQTIPLILAQKRMWKETMEPPSGNWMRRPCFT